LINSNDKILNMKAIDIRNIRKEMGKTQSQFAKLIGVSKNSVQLWETEKRNPSIGMVFLIKETYKKHTENLDNLSSSINSRPVIELRPDAKANTLIADVKASAGFGAILDNPKKLEKLPSISLPNAPFGLNVAFQIEGDSMHPTIRHLDFVAANQLNDINDIRDGYTYIIIDRDDGVLCKRLYREGVDFKIVSDNPNYPPYKRSQYDVLAFFKCFMRLSTDFRTYHDDVRNAIQELRVEVQQIKLRIDT